MVTLEWGTPGSKIYEAGVDRGAFYPMIGPGVPWVGLVNVNENVAGGEQEALYYDGVKYYDFIASEDFQATVSSFSTPPEFDVCNGVRSLAAGLFVTGQPRLTFGMSYRVLIGNDVDGLNYGYKLHLAYTCTVPPSEKPNTTLSAQPELTPREWIVYTVPPPAVNYKPTAHFIIDSTKTPGYMLENLESVLYGTDDTDPRLPTQAEVISLLTMGA